MTHLAAKALINKRIDRAVKRATQKANSKRKPNAAELVRRYHQKVLNKSVPDDKKLRYVLVAWDRLTADQRTEVARRFKELNAMDSAIKPVAMEGATHNGKRLNTPGLCEKCGNPTHWVVTVLGRVGAYWCGCGN